MVALAFRINPAAPYEPFPKVKLGAIHCHLHILNAELELQEALCLASGDHPAGPTAGGNEVIICNGVYVCKNRLGEVWGLVNDGFAPPEGVRLLNACVLIHKRRLELAQ